MHTVFCGQSSELRPSIPDRSPSTTLNIAPCERSEHGLQRLLVIAALNIILMTRLNAQWELRYPDIPPDQINDLHFLDNATGFAVNSAGSVLMTTNGGDTWRITSHFQRNFLSEMQFVDNTHGFAISPYSHIGDDVSFIFTIDGGRHWSAANVMTGDALAFLPLSTAAITKSTAAGIVARLDNFFGLWRVTYTLPTFMGGDVRVPYGTVKQFLRLPSGRVLALGSNDAAKQAGVISDSVAFILASDDSASTWRILWSDLPYSAQSFFFFNDSIGWLGGETDRIYKTTDGGVSWIFQYCDSSQQVPIRSICSPDGIHVFATDGSGRVLRSSDGGAHWQFVQVARYYNAPATISFLNPAKGFLAGPEFLRTTDGGVTWRRVSTSLKGNFRTIDFVTEHTGFGVGDSSVYKTRDGGMTWTEIYHSPGRFFSGVDMIDSLHLWVTSYDSLFRSTDGGTTWHSSRLDSRVTLMRGVQFLDALTGIVYEVWQGDSTFNYVTTDGGTSWNKYSINNVQYLPSFRKVKFTDPRHVWFANQNGAWLSTDTAKTWTLYPLDGAHYAFDFADSVTGWVSIWGGQFKKVALTTNGGSSWELVERPYASQTEDMLSYRDGNQFGGVVMYAAGYDGSLTKFRQGDPYVYDIATYTSGTLFSFATYRQGNVLHMWVAGEGMILLHQTSIVTGIGVMQHAGPATFALLQNYPNPFNSTTIINYQLPIGNSQFVTLKVFDVLGREVATLVNEVKEPGEYSVTFDGTGLASGVYFYQLRSSDFIGVKRMLLIR